MEGQTSVSTGGSAVSARSVEGQASVSTGGGAVSARSAEGQASVCTGGSVVSASSVEAQASPFQRLNKKAEINYERQRYAKEAICVLLLIFSHFFFIPIKWMLVSMVRIVLVIVVLTRIQSTYTKMY